MYYGNYQSGGFVEPNFMPNMQPQGYNINAQYQSFGPNAMPMPINNMNMAPTNNDNNSYNGSYIDEYDQRITKLERQIRRIDQRLRKLENAGTSNNIDEDINIVDSNMYMI